MAVHQMPLLREHAINLETEDLITAKMNAAPYIANHHYIKWLSHAYHSDRPDGLIGEHPEYPAGTDKLLKDGRRVMADLSTVMVRHPDGRIESHANKTPRSVLPLIDHLHDGKVSTPMRRRPALRAALKMDCQRSAEAGTDLEDIVLDAYRANMSDRDKAAMLRMMRQFRESEGNKLIADCTRADVRKWMNDRREGLLSDGKKVVHSTIVRDLDMMNAFVNWSKTERADNPFKGDNIFSGHKVDRTRNSRQPITEGDWEKIKAHKHLFSDQEWLMLAALATTSVRPIGLASIRHCGFVEERVREKSGKFKIVRTRVFYIQKDKHKVGTTNHGRRTLPIPEALINLTNSNGDRIFPSVINGPLFPKKSGQKIEHFLSILHKSINSKLKEIGVHQVDLKDSETGELLEKGKSFYSFRHRAMDILEDVAPSSAARYIMGHQPDQHEGYGSGPKMHKLKEYLDQIPF